MKLKYVGFIIFQLMAHEVQAAPAIYSCQFKELKTHHNIENRAKIIYKNYTHDAILEKAMDQNTDQEVIVLDVKNFVAFIENAGPDMIEIMTIAKKKTISSEFSALLTIQYIKKEIRSYAIRGMCVLSQRG